MSKIYTNDLCLFFLTTLKEYESGDLSRAINYYLENSLNCKYKFDLYVFLDTLPHKGKRGLYKTLGKFQKHENLNKIKILSNNIPEHLNLYMRSLKSKIDLSVLTLGRSHGINYHFYYTLYFLLETKYKNFMLLETDTKPLTNKWFDIIHDYAINNDFCIAGSTYKGSRREFVLQSYYSGHLNGVGLYKNKKETFELLKNSEMFIKNELLRDSVKRYKKYHEFMNYDVAIYLYAKKHDIVECLKDTPYFTNISTPGDEHISIPEVLDEFPDTQVVHRKELYM
jgi:hypothetical protein